MFINKNIVPTLFAIANLTSVIQQIKNSTLQSETMTVENTVVKFTNAKIAHHGNFPPSENCRLHSDFTSRYLAGGWTVNALNTFHTVTEAVIPDVHICRASGSIPTAFLHVSQRTTHVVAFQPITDFLDKTTYILVM